MLTARASKRDKANFFDSALLFDILDGGARLGQIRCDWGRECASITLGGEVFPVERLAPGEGRAPKSRYALIDPGGETIATAEQDRETFTLRLGDERFVFRSGRSRLYFHLYDGPADQPLGGVGQKKFWTLTLNLDLPPRFAPAFQAFLLVLLQHVIMQRAGNLTPL